MLAGLTSRNQTKSRTGLPLLSQIPLLGVLFGSDGVRSQEMENLIFIVPTVVDAVSMPARERIKEAMRVYSEYSGDLDETKLLEQPNLPASPGRSKANRTEPRHDELSKHRPS